MTRARTVLTLLVALAGATSAHAQDVALGQELYARHCATCHGVAARGDGPMASVLLVKPVNLAELAAQNGGTFPLARVVMRIDGRDPLVSHGSPMPVYGPFFEGDLDAAIKTPAGQPVLTARPVVDLVMYLQSIQVEG